MIDADELVEKKQKLFKRVFGAKYSLSLLGMQASQKANVPLSLHEPKALHLSVK